MPCGGLDGGQFFRGNTMQVDIVDGHTVKITLDDVEAQFVQRECMDNEISPKEMFEMLFSILFVGGYSNLIGKE